MSAVGSSSTRANTASGMVSCGASRRDDGALTPRAGSATASSTFVEARSIAGKLGSASTIGGRATGSAVSGPPPPRRQGGVESTQPFEHVRLTPGRSAACGSLARGARLRRGHLGFSGRRFRRRATRRVLRLRIGWRAGRRVGTAGVTGSHGTSIENRGPTAGAPPPAAHGPFDALAVACARWRCTITVTTGPRRQNATNTATVASCKAGGRGAATAHASERCGVGSALGLLAMEHRLTEGGRPHRQQTGEHQRQRHQEHRTAPIGHTLTHHNHLVSTSWIVVRAQRTRRRPGGRDRDEFGLLLVVVVAGQDGGDGCDDLTVVEAHQTHAGGVTALGADVAGAHANGDTTARHGDDLVVGTHHERRDDLALLAGELDADDARSRHDPGR